MNAEILAVGTEILLGDILNTNAQYLSRELANLGINLFYQTVVGDNKERLLNAFELAFKRADLVITTGGLGPTEDDLTKETASEFFNKELIIDDYSLKKIKEFFIKQNIVMTENNVKQAYVLEDSVVAKNEKGSAPGCIFEKDGKILIMLPGPPFEMIPMFENEIYPFLMKKTNTTLFSKTLKLVGMGESLVADAINDLLESQTNPSIAPYAKSFEVHLRITALAKDKEEAEELIKPVTKAIYSKVGEYIYGEDNDTLESVVAKLLLKNNLTIACAESCTGGMLSSKLVDYPGISEVLKESCVTYSNEAKINRLGVSSQTIEKFGAVSIETAKEMAEGIAKTAGTSVGISTTGVAGPSGGTKEKPVGLIYLGLCINNNLYSKELTLRGDRQTIRTRATIIALDFLRRNLSENCKN